MLVCYLDDSGTDPQSPIVTLAGYVARDDDWATYEVAVEPLFTEYGVSVLHARDLHATDGEFSDKERWTRLRKQAFVSRICQVRNPHVMMGLSMSALKKQYGLRADESGRKRTATPYAFCFNVINDWIFRNIHIGPVSNTEGVAYIIEGGNVHDGEIEKEFFSIRDQHHDIAHLMHSISFVGKSNCRAIQLADLIAFYSRRDGIARLVAQQAGKESYSIDAMTQIIIENLPHLGFVATDFGPDAPGSRFLAGDP